MEPTKHSKIKLREVNRHLVCRLCRGYYIDATTIAECLHSFCRSCIIKYLENHSFCPVCEVQIHKTKPYLNLRLDKALQDVVYKLVPGLYHNEMRRRREFYAKHKEQIPVTTPEQCGLEERIIFSPDDSISLSLEYLESGDFEKETVSSQSSESGDNQDVFSFPQQLGLIKLKSDNKTSRRESQDVQEGFPFAKRYLQCPAVVSIFHLKKFIRMKHDLTEKMQVNIIHKRVPLPDHYTLMDVAYIYTWKRSSPMRFFYNICEVKRQKLKILPSLDNTEESKIEPVSGVATLAEDIIVNKRENGVVSDKITDKNENDVVISEVKSEVVNNEKPEPEEKKQTINGCAKSQNNSELVLINEKTVPSSEKSDILIANHKEEVKEKNKKEVSNVLKEDKQIKPPESLEVKNRTAQVKENGIEETSNKNVDKQNERLLLNPISGQLESVPSHNQTKTVVSEKKLSGDKNENDEGTKKSVSEQKIKKQQSENSKDKRRSYVSLLKKFRKEKPGDVKESKKQSKSFNENSTLSFLPYKKSEKADEKQKADVSVEIKADKNESEYDFDGTSPPNKFMSLQEYSKMSKHLKCMSWEKSNSWMSLQDFRDHMLKKNNSNEDLEQKEKRKSVPSLFRIGSEGNVKQNSKTPNVKLSDEIGKPKKSFPTIININTENVDKNKAEIKIDLPLEKARSPPKPIKIENKGGEYSIKQREDENSKIILTDKNLQVGVKEMDENKAKDSNKRKHQDKIDNDLSKKNKTVAEEKKNDNFGAIDLSKTDSSPRDCKNPLENLMDLASKSGTSKSDENMVEALISAAQNQSIEPLLKIPQYAHSVKNPSQGSPPQARNISSNDISQALQFFRDLRSDIKTLEAKSQLSPNSFIEHLSQKSANLEPLQLYHQHINLIRRLKRQHMSTIKTSETPQRKSPKLSPTSETKKKVSPESKAKISPPHSDEAAAQFKSSLERMLFQIQDQMELQSRMVAAQTYKNLPPLLQFYNHPSAFCPTPPSPSKSSQNKLKQSSLSPNSPKSPNSRKSPQCLASPPVTLPLAMSNPEASFFTAQKYNQLINAGLNSEMTFHQTFQNYLNQQEKINQLKHSQTLNQKQQNLPFAKSISDLYYGPQTPVKKLEPPSVGAVQKT